MNNEGNKLIGIFYVILSSIGFGVMPVLVKLAYKGGANPMNTLVLRFAFASIILFGYIKIKKISLKISKKQGEIIFLMGACGYSLTAILVFFAYKYVDVGIAGVILYSYPIMVMILSIIFYKEKIKAKKVICVLMTFAGIAVMVDIQSGVHISVLGIVLVLFAALGYAVYCLGGSSKEVKDLDNYVVTFYLACITTIMGGVIGLATNSFNKPIALSAIFIILIISIVSTVAALMLFLKGVKIIGATNAAVFSAMEPIVSLVLGVIILGEVISVKIITGSILVIASMIILAKDTVKK
ncbi:MAG: DMT family transporter [Clostridium sp.]